MKTDSNTLSNRRAAWFHRRLHALACAAAAAVALCGCRPVNQEAPPAPEQISAPAAPRRLPEKISAMRFPPRQEAAIKKSINNRLTAWQASIEARDIEKHLAFYADEIETYYMMPDAAKVAVRSDRERAFEQFDTLKVQLINIDIYLQSKDEAVVTFDKSWDFKKADSFSNGLVQQEIKMRKIEKQWVIVSEKDLQIYRYRNS